MFLIGLKLVVNLQGSNLTSEQYGTARSRMIRGNRTYFRKIVDFELWDAIQDLFDGERDRVELLSQLREAALDDRVSKSFKHSGPTMDSLQHYNVSEPDNFCWNENFRLASDLLSELLNIRKLKPLVYKNAEELRRNLPNKDASCGAMAEGTKADNVEAVFQSYLGLKEQIANGESPWIPALSFHRAQLSKYTHNGKLTLDKMEYKDRLVWGLSADHVAIESQYAIPFINEVMSKCPFYAGGREPKDLRAMVKRLQGSAKYWYSLDFSKFDQTIPSWLIRHVFGLIRQCFGKECEAELKWIEHEFIHTKIIDYNGDVWEKDLGIPSGSNFTQAVGSICNALVITTYLVAREYGESIRVRESYVRGGLGQFPKRCRMITMGDDNLFVSTTRVDLSDLSEYVKRNFGMKIHPDKSDHGDSRVCNPVFLKREWTRNGESRDLLDLLVNVIHPERIREYDGYSGYHLLFGLVVTYSAAFPRWSSEFLMRKMKESNGGLESLRHLQGRNMPGVLRQLGDKSGDFFYRQAKARLRDVA